MACRNEENMGVSGLENLGIESRDSEDPDGGHSQ